MSIPHLYVTGTHYEVGNRIGNEFKNRIKKYLSELDFKGVILPFIESEHGKQIMKEFTSLIIDKFPWYYDELKGLSAGSGIELDHILAINYRVEIFHLIDKSNSSVMNSDSESIMFDNDYDINNLPIKNQGCTDLFLTNNDNKYACKNIMLHNEDSSPAVYNTCYMVTCKIISSDYNGIKSPVENFTTYCYPGHLPGNAFGFNSNGFAFGVNALYPKKIILNRLPRQILTRLMLSVRTLDEFESMIINNPISYALSINVGYFGSDKNHQLSSKWKHFDFFNELNILPSLFNYEITSNSSNNVTNLTSKHSILNKNLKIKEKSNDFSIGYFYHVNYFQKMSEIQVPDRVESSINRLDRLNEIPEPNDLNELLKIASDDVNVNFPIFRVPSETDKAQTVAIAVFDFNKKFMSIYVDKPTDSEPLLKILMD